MNNMIKVVIVDDNADFLYLLDEYMQKSKDIKVVGLARDGIQAIDLIKISQPDVVVLDIVMPNMDGISVLENVVLMKMQPKPLFIMLTAIGQDRIVQNAISLGAEYYMVKPINIEVLVARIRQLYHDKKSFTLKQSYTEAPRQEVAPPVDLSSTKHSSIEGHVSTLIKEFGISPHVIGYQYAREAVLTMLQNPKAFKSITKMIYPAVAEKFNTSPQKVERAIRNAIESAWQKNGSNSEQNSEKKKPTNYEFVAMLVENIRLNPQI